VAEVLYVHAKNKQQAANKLTAAMAQVSNWLNNSCLHLNVNKTVCVFIIENFWLTTTPMFLLMVKISWWCSGVFKYLGRLHSKMTFKKQVKFNVANFRHIGPYLTTEAANLFMHAMVFSHKTYCFTSWSQMNTTSYQTNWVTVQTDNMLNYNNYYNK